MKNKIKKMNIEKRKMSWIEWILLIVLVLGIILLIKMLVTGGIN